MIASMDRKIAGRRGVYSLLLLMVVTFISNISFVNFTQRYAVVYNCPTQNPIEVIADQLS